MANVCKTLIYLLMMLSTLSFASWNSHGFAADRLLYCTNLVEKYNFVLLQEHWLLPGELNTLDSKIPHTCAHAVSGMEGNDLLKGRPYGGSAILWQNNLNASVKPITFNSNRICAIAVQMQNFKFLLCSIYMPTDTCNDKSNSDMYMDILDQISTTADNLNISHVLIGGDLNTSFERPNSLHTKGLLSFLQTNSMNCCISHPVSSVDFSYESKANNVRSTIDHFVCTNNMWQSIIDYTVVHDMENPSDHSVIALHTCLPISHSPSSDTHRVASPRWNKATLEDIGNYQQALDNILSQLLLPSDTLSCNDLQCSVAKHRNDIDGLVDSITDACLMAATMTIPQTDSGEHKHKVVPGWREQVEPHRQTALFWHSIWVQCNRPRLGHVATIRRRTRAIYHRSIRDIKKQKEKIVADNMAFDFATKDSKSFWNSVKTLKNKGQSLPSTVDSATDSSSISDLFANKFNTLYNSVSYNTQDMERVSEDID
jgi:hypothetical protein